MESKVRKGIGLVAHDAMKKDLIEWVLWNSELLMGNKFYYRYYRYLNIESTEGETSG